MSVGAPLIHRMSSCCDNSPILFALPAKFVTLHVLGKDYHLRLIYLTKGGHSYMICKSWDMPQNEETAASNDGNFPVIFAQVTLKQTKISITDQQLQKKVDLSPYHTPSENQKGVLLYPVKDSEWPCQ